MALDISDSLKSGYLDCGIQTEGSPLPDSRSTVQQRNPGCTCVCSCKGDPPVSTMAVVHRELLPPVSDRSLLGNQPPRFSRVTNRVVSLPELEGESTPVSCLRPRVASMPETYPPTSPDDLDAYDYDTGPHQGRVWHSPSTPSPPQARRKNIVVCRQDERAYYREFESQDWITWASSPPKPIPALHGPLSLPYARCPSGAEGTIIESDDRVSNMIWGLENPTSQGRAQVQSVDHLATAQDSGHGTGSTSRQGSGNLALAANRLAEQMNDLAINVDSKRYLGSGQPQYGLSSALGLYLGCDPTPNLEARGFTYEQRALQNQSSDLGSMKGGSSRRTLSLEQPKPARQSVTQLPTPPSSTLAHWTPRLSNIATLSGGFSPIPEAAPMTPALFTSRQSSLPTPVLDCYEHAKLWQARPNSIAPTQNLQDYSLGSDGSLPAADCLDLYDYFPQELRLKAGWASAPRPESAAHKASRMDTPARPDYGAVLSRQDSKAALTASTSRALHRRLPVLEEDISFNGPSLQGRAPTPGFTNGRRLVPTTLLRSAQVGNSLDTTPDAYCDRGEKASRKTYRMGSNNRTAGAQGSQRQSNSSESKRGVAGERTPVDTYTAPHRRWKEKREV
ncbi:hypothetical protein DFP72DRAFT_1165734 [Ephemerocybe angulata]|uniref:Uncharacterized protein n=1 Tax=Ephemerocybe angulata TaxID=980116 RepID=A0A8H6IBR3_9AGAR|nr:hypothetical protein DFP72DRAFT_1165734 [Tulosesus angulatus]